MTDTELMYSGQKQDMGRDPFDQNSNRSDREVVHLKRWTRFFETFPVGPHRIEFWTKISGNFG